MHKYADIAKAAADWPYPPVRRTPIPGIDMREPPWENPAPPQPQPAPAPEPPKGPKPWHGGKMEATPDGQGFRYTDPEGKVTDVPWTSIGPMYYAKKNGVTGDSSDGRSYNQVMSAVTGTDDYMNDYSGYWKTIPDADWNKVFRPVPKDRRTFTGYTPPNIAGTVCNPEQPDSRAWYDWGQGYMYSPSGTDFSKYYRNQRASDYIGSSDREYVGFMQGLDPSLLGGYRPHELTHANQIRIQRPQGDGSIQAGLMNGTGLWGALRRLTGFRSADRPSEANSRHPELALHNLPQGEATGALNTDGYTENRKEEAVKMRALKDGLIAAQNLMREHPESFGMFTEAERKALMGIDPWFKSEADARKAVDVLTANPRIAMTTGPEAMRALSTASDYRRARQARQAGDPVGSLHEAA